MFKLSVCIGYIIQWLELLKNVCRNDLIEVTFDSYMRFFESIHLYTKERREVTYVYQEEEDNMKFIEYELMLCFIAILLKNECFVAVADLFNTSFYNKLGNTLITIRYKILYACHKMLIVI